MNKLKEARIKKVQPYDNITDLKHVYMCTFVCISIVIVLLNCLLVMLKVLSHADI